jgi:hypothetical protein
MSPLSPTDSSSLSTSLPHFQSATKGRMPVFRYNLTIPTQPIGPQDFVSVPVSILPLESGMIVKSASLIIERRLHLCDPHGPTSSLPSTTPALTVNPSSVPTSSRPRRPRTAPSDGSLTPTQSTVTAFQRMPAPPAASRSPGVLSSAAPSSISISASSSLTVSDYNEATPLLRSGFPASSPPPPLSTPRPESTVTNVIASSESSGAFFSRLAPSPSSSCSSLTGSSDVWSKTLTVQWPMWRSNTRWAIGETTRTELAHVCYIIRVKVVVSSPSLGTEVIELDGDATSREILVASSNEAERRLALAKYSESVSQKKSKSQSPKRRTRGTDDEQDELDRSAVGGAGRRGKKQLPSPPESPPAAASPPLWAPDANTSGSSATSSDLGPDTPASSALELQAMQPAKSAKFKKSSKDRISRPPRISRRPHTSAGPGDTASSARSGNVSMGSGSPDLVFRRSPANGDGWVAQDPQKGPSQSALVSDNEVRAWEEELARIEAVSRSSSMNMISTRRPSSRGNIIGT